MKIVPLLTGFIFLALAGISQTGSVPAVDKSPMDISYYPADYPVLKIRDKATEPLIARVVYSRPQKSGRTIFGDLIEYGSVWRLGANEATEIELYKAVKIGDKKIPKGRYTLYAIVNTDNWTFILNKDTETWGAFKYNADKDVARTTVPVQKTTEVAENFSMWFAKTETGCNLVVAWDTIKVNMPINLK